MMNNTSHPSREIDRLFGEVLRIAEESATRDDFAKKVSALSQEANSDWNSLDRLDQNIFLGIIKTLLEEKFDCAK
jgi:hypothetical protein